MPCPYVCTPSSRQASGGFIRISTYPLASEVGLVLLTREVELAQEVPRRTSGLGGRGMGLRSGPLPSTSSLGTRTRWRSVPCERRIEMTEQLARTHHLRTFLAAALLDPLLRL